jgi:hypothetical protein
MQDVARPGKVIANRFGLRGRRPKNAKAIQGAQGRSRYAMLSRFDAASSALTRRVGFRYDPAQHVDEQTR